MDFEMMMDFDYCAISRIYQTKYYYDRVKKSKF